MITSAWSGRLRQAADGALPLCALAASAALVAAMAASVPGGGAADATPAAGHDLGALSQRLQTRLADAPAAAQAQDWALLARSHAAMGQLEPADAAYVRARAAAPHDAELMAEHAQLMVQRGTRADAQAVRTLTDAALAADPRQPLALALRGDAAYERGELAQAQAHWQAARERVAPADQSLAAALAQRLALVDDARQAFDRALERERPGSTAAPR